ncbi:bZIP transcription factor 53-like [Abrus precatorius]|uniref:BZIP transcription factor 53-like n=1 Tax=Abrus precatorius TaxID=3816 RepID=A0A8B8KR86_ABRPR|nr:bZIP transcription factor 53-like [Abrus precatorius]
MLSTLPPSDLLLGNPFSAFSGGFTPWDCHDIFSPATPIPVTSSSGSDEPNQTHEKPKPDPDELDRHVASVMDERKRRRMISNRESARRSRMRKQRHLENLRNQLNKCRIENGELNNRLQFVVHHCNRVRTENEWLRSERTLLRQKVSNLTQILVFQQLQPFNPPWTCNTSAIVTE